jgi:hypothetical protein
MMYLGMVEEMINEMIKQYAYLLAQKLKVTKDLDDDDPVIVTLHNILMVAPKTENGKYELTVKDEIAKEEEDISAYDEDDKPLTFDDFKKRFQIKHSMFAKKDNTGNNPYNK